LFNGVNWKDKPMSRAAGLKADDNSFFEESA
jgi:hypothetical protein